MGSSNRTLKIASLFFFFLVALIIFLLAVFKIIVEERKLPSLVASDKSRAIWGSIVTKGGYQAAYSSKYYQVDVYTPGIDPAKMDLFVNLFHIYSGLPKDLIKKRLKKRGNVTLARAIDTKTAYQLRLLSRKLLQMDIFIPYRYKNTYVKRGITIIEKGERRHYPFGDTLTPVIGYVLKDWNSNSNYLPIVAQKGLERYYADKLRPKQDGIIKGRRDVGFNIILNKEALIKKRIDGFNVHLNVDMQLQKGLEKILDRMRLELGAQEIIAAVMESDTGRIVAIATTNRYDPNRIKSLEPLNAKVVEYPFEPGSVMKPITFALLLEHGLVSPFDIVKGYNGRYKLGRKIITDEHKFDWLSAENVIVHSSNIGIAQLAQRLPYDLYYHGLKKFGFAQPTGIDLPYEKSGKLQPIYRFKSEIYKATIGYGYGIRVTFMQLLNAYNVFNNGGKRITPRIAAFLSEPGGKKRTLPPQKVEQVISSKTAATMHRILQKVVEKGTGKEARIEGLEIGGKTGTAQIAKRGGRGYGREYHSSFFGFANDKERRYTIGVLVIRPSFERHFASQSAVPVFRSIVLELITQGYLTIKP